MIDVVRVGEHLVNQDFSKDHNHGYEVHQKPVNERQRAMDRSPEVRPTEEEQDETPKMPEEHGPLDKVKSDGTNKPDSGINGIESAMVNVGGCTIYEFKRLLTPSHGKNDDSPDKKEHP